MIVECWIAFMKAMLGYGQSWEITSKSASRITEDLMPKEARHRPGRKKQVKVQLPTLKLLNH